MISLDPCTLILLSTALQQLSPLFSYLCQVNKMAQKTDAQQMSRNLLLCPRATVNVKPNLQIIADDVKCTHGCTVSDLEEEELFYFQVWNQQGLGAYIY